MTFQNMKTRVGQRLKEIREDRKLTQAEMADLLHVSAPTYSRLERNETSADLEQVARFAQKLDVPIQDFLPETISVKNDNSQGQVGLVIGNVYVNQEKSEEITHLQNELALKTQEVVHLKEKNDLLQKQIENLEALVAALKEK
jgi:transcriptional regulator with XRE-family HTH domain